MTQKAEFHTFATCRHCLAELAEGSEWGPYYPHRHAEDGSSCPRCGRTPLSLCTPTPTYINLFSITGGTQVGLPSRLTDHDLSLITPECYPVAETILRIAHATVDTLRVPIINSALLCAPESTGRNVVFASRPHEQDAFIGSALSQFELHAGEIANKRMISVGNPDFESFIENVRARSKHPTSERVNSLDLLDALIPGPEDTWIGIDFEVCAGIREVIGNARVNPTSYNPKTLNCGLHLIPGPDRILVVPTERFLQCALDSTEESLRSYNTAAHFVAPIEAPYATLLRDFEDLINDKKVSETAIQQFLEDHPRLLLGSEHQNMRRELTLTPAFTVTGSDVGDLRPDFFLERVDRPLWDILELKLPSAKLLRGARKRRGFAYDLRSALDQLREYYFFFLDSANRKWFREKYGMDLYFPNLSLVIGRSSEFRSPFERQKLEHDAVVAGKQVRLYTYDDLLKIARLRESSVHVVR